jgi:hypothetical protein
MDSDGGELSTCIVSGPYGAVLYQKQPRYLSENPILPVEYFAVYMKLPANGRLIRLIWGMNFPPLVQCAGTRCTDQAGPVSSD